MTKDQSEKMMLACEAVHIAAIKKIPGTNAEVLATLSSIYRAGWRDCWEAQQNS